MIIFIDTKRQRVLNFVKLHCVLKDLFIKEKWYFFLSHDVYIQVTRLAYRA